MRITHVCIRPHLVVEALAEPTETKALTDEHRTPPPPTYLVDTRL